MTEDFVAMLRQQSIQPRVILDVGSRDALQALELHREFPAARVFCFEAQPESAANCRRNTAGNPHVQVVERAVHELHDMKVSFYPVVASNGVKGANPGASSLFRACNDGFHEVYEQDEIRVDSIRLDAWARDNDVSEIDVVWMDLQGGELLALRGMGHLIETVKAIHLEMIVRPMYAGQPTFEETDGYLRKHGLEQICFHQRCPDWWGDAIYIRDRLA